MPNETAGPAARLSEHVAIVECADEVTLDELLAGPLGPHVVRRLSETVAVVDHAHFELLLKGLARAGYTPSVSGEARA